MEYDFIKERTDTQYTDIENFKNYEFTECIVFELAVRAAKDTLIELIELKTQEGSHLERRKRISELEKKLKEEYWLEPSYFYQNTNIIAIPKKDTLIKKIKKNLLATKNYSRSLDRKEELKFDDFNPTEEEVKKGIRRLIPQFNSLSYAYHYFFLLEAFPEEYKLELTIKGDENEFTGASKNGNTSHGGGETYTLKAYTDTIKKSERTLKKKKSRPSLIVPKEHSNELLVKINPNLPPEENMAFLEDALKNIYARKSSLSMNELIKLMPNKEEDISIETINHEGNKHKKKKLADMFFIYDYVTYFLEDAISHNKTIDKELLDPQLDKYDEARFREDLSIYTDPKNIINSDEYGKQLSQQLSDIM